MIYIIISNLSIKSSLPLDFKISNKLNSITLGPFQVNQKQIEFPTFLSSVSSKIYYSSISIILFIMNNRNKIIHKHLYSQFKQNFNIIPLHQYCQKVYISNKTQIGQTFSHLFSIINFANKRMIFQEKQEIFIKEWKNILGNKTKINFTLHWQELITIIELLTQKIKKIQLYVNFLNQVTKASWDELKSKMIRRITQFLDEISKIIKRILLKYNKNQKIKQTLQLLQKYKSQPVTGQKNNQQQDASLKEGTQGQSKSNRRLSSNTLKNLRESLQFLRLFSSKERGNSFSSLQIATAKMFTKQKQTTPQLIGSEQMEALRKSLHEQYSVVRMSKPTGFVGMKHCKTQGNQDNEVLSNNELKKITALEQLVELQQSKYSQISHDFQSNFQPRKKIKKVIRHYKSSYQDKNKISKMIESKMPKYKFNSIRKIEQNDQKHRNNTQVLRSITKEHSVKKTEAHSNLLKKNDLRSSQLMKNNNRSSQSNRIVKKNDKTPDIGMTSNKQSVIKHSFTKIIKKNGGQDEVQSQIEDKGSKKSLEQDQNNNGNNQRQSKTDFEQTFNNYRHAQKKEKKKKTLKKRFVNSIKKIKTGNSIDQILSKRSIKALQRPSIVETKKKFHRTSLFRSSGLNLAQKKHSTRTGFSSKSHIHPKKLNAKCHEEMMTKTQELQIAQIIQEVQLCKKSNKSIVNEVMTYKIDKNALVNTLQLNNIFSEIHEQSKKDHSNEYSDYHDEILKRKYENSVHYHQLQLTSCQDKFFKLDSFITQAPKMMPIFNKENKCIDFMKKYIRVDQNITLEQLGVNIDDAL